MSKFNKYSLKEQLNFQELYQKFLGMLPRQQIIVLVLLGVFLLFLIILPVSCASSYLQNLEEQISSSDKNFNSLALKVKEYQRLQTKLNRVQENIKTKAQTPLDSELEKIIQAAGLSENTRPLNPKERNEENEFTELFVKVDLRQVSLDQIIDFINRVEQHRGLNLRVTRINIKTNRTNRRQFNADFDVATLVAKQ